MVTRLGDSDNTQEKTTTMNIDQLKLMCCKSIIDSESERLSLKEKSTRQKRNQFIQNIIHIIKTNAAFRDIVFGSREIFAEVLSPFGPVIRRRLDLTLNEVCFEYIDIVTRQDEDVDHHFRWRYCFHFNDPGYALSSDISKEPHLQQDDYYENDPLARGEYRNILLFYGPKPKRDVHCYYVKFLLPVVLGSIHPFQDIHSSCCFNRSNENLARKYLVNRLLEELIGRVERISADLSKYEKMVMVMEWWSSDTVNDIVANPYHHQISGQNPQMAVYNYLQQHEHHFVDFPSPGKCNFRFNFGIRFFSESSSYRVLITRCEIHHLTFY